MKTPLLALAFLPIIVFAQSIGSLTKVPKGTVMCKDPDLMETVTRIIDLGDTSGNPEGGRLFVEQQVSRGACARIEEELLMYIETDASLYTDPNLSRLETRDGRRPEFPWVASGHLDCCYVLKE